MNFTLNVNVSGGDYRATTSAALPNKVCASCRLSECQCADDVANLDNNALSKLFQIDGQRSNSTTFPPCSSGALQNPPFH